MTIEGLTRILPVLLLALAPGAFAEHRHMDSEDWDEYPHESAEYDEPDRRPKHALDPLGMGPYLGLQFVAAPEAYRNGARRRIGGNGNVDESVGFAARVGHRFHPHLAVELQSEWIEGYDLQQFSSDHSEVRTFTNTLNGKFFFGHGRFQPYAMGGVGLQRAWVRRPAPGGVNFDDVAFVGRLGGGFDIHLNSHLALNVESSYVVPTGDLDDYDTVSIGLGLVYRF